MMLLMTLCRYAADFFGCCFRAADAAAIIDAAAVFAAFCYAADFRYATCCFSLLPLFTLILPRRHASYAAFR